MPRVLALLLLLPFLASALALPTHATTPPRAPTTQRAAAPSDAQIEATLRTKLAKSKIGKDGFRFRVQRGVVTWEGTTNVVQHKGSATRMARTSGAIQVINNIQVSASAKAKASANLRKASVQQ